MSSTAWREKNLLNAGNQYTTAALRGALEAIRAGQSVDAALQIAIDSLQAALHPPVDDISGLTALTTLGDEADLRDGETVLVQIGVADKPQEWMYDAESEAEPDDATVLMPDDHDPETPEAGRLLIVGGGGSGGVTLDDVHADQDAKGVNGYRKVLGFVSNEAALSEDPSLDDAYIANDSHRVYYCVAEAVNETPAEWNYLTAGTQAFVVRDTVAGKTYAFILGVWREIPHTIGDSLYFRVADEAFSGAWNESGKDTTKSYLSLDNSVIWYYNVDQWTLADSADWAFCYVKNTMVYVSGGAGHPAMTVIDALLKNQVTYQITFAGVDASGESDVESPVQQQDQDFAPAQYDEIISVVGQDTVLKTITVPTFGSESGALAKALVSTGDPASVKVVFRHGDENDFSDYIFTATVLRT
jgi:hypothetical protein